MVPKVILALVGENLPLAFRDIQDGRQDGHHGYWVYKKTALTFCKIQIETQFWCLGIGF